MSLLGFGRRRSARCSVVPEDAETASHFQAGRRRLRWREAARKRQRALAGRALVYGREQTKRLHFVLLAPVIAPRSAASRRAGARWQPASFAAVSQAAKVLYEHPKLSRAVFNEARPLLAPRFL